MFTECVDVYKIYNTLHFYLKYISNRYKYYISFHDQVIVAVLKNVFTYYIFQMI